jgi:hypothetical protein
MTERPLLAPGPGGLSSCEEAGVFGPGRRDLLGPVPARDSYRKMTFEELVAAHGPALWRAVASYAPPGAERDDLAQDDCYLHVRSGRNRAFPVRSEIQFDCLRSRSGAADENPAALQRD